MLTVKIQKEVINHAHAFDEDKLLLDCIKQTHRKTLTKKSHIEWSWFHVSRIHTVFVLNNGQWSTCGYTGARPFKNRSLRVSISLMFHCSIAFMIVLDFATMDLENVEDKVFG